MSGQSITARLLFIFSGHNFNGLRLSQIAGGIQESASTTLRALQRMEADGLVEQNPLQEGHWRLSPRVIQLAIAHHDEFQRESQRLTDFNNRYTRKS